MSQAKHRSYRKILSITHGTTAIAGQVLPVTEVLYCSVNSLTSRTVKADLVGYKVYVGNYKSYGVDAWHPRKPVSINLKRPLDSKFFKDIGEYSIKRTKQNAFNDAYKSYVMGRNELSKNLTGIVEWWSGTEGRLKCDTLGISICVYSCNIAGAKTWYPETACMYLKAGEIVHFDLADMGDYFTAAKVRGNVYFNSEKWSSLDQDRLAFKCDENGKAINGLFESKAKCGAA